MKYFNTLLLVFTFSSSFACKCVDEYKKRFKKDAHQASIIFYGYVVETDKTGQSAKMKIIEPFKTVLTDNDTIVIGGFISSCSVSFKSGEYVLVYSYSSSEPIVVSVCSSTIGSMIENGNSELNKQRKKLRKIYPTVKTD